MVRKRLRYRDLVALGIVKNRITLRNWIIEHGFPRGQQLGPNTRVWPGDEVEVWLASRPVGPKDRIPPPSARRPPKGSAQLRRKTKPRTDLKRESRPEEGRLFDV